MKRPSPVQIIMGIGFLTVLLGLGMMAHTFSARAELTQRLISKRDFLLRLTTLGQEWQHAQTIKQAYESLTPAATTPIQVIINECFTNRPVTPSPTTSTSPLPGWVEWQTSLGINDISLSDLAPFLQRLADQQPPWTVTRCDISAVGQAKGRVRVTLGLASLRRTSWSAPGENQPVPVTP